MQLQQVWYRYVGSPVGPATKVLGGDGFPTDSTSTASPKPYRKANASTEDNALLVRSSSINGWPLSRIAVAAVAAQASPVAVSILGYVWDDRLGFWIQMPASATTITPGVSLAGSGAAAVPVFFDAMALIDDVPTASTLGSAQAGNSAFLFIVAAGASPSGLYTFVAGGDLTTTPF